MGGGALPTPLYYTRYMIMDDETCCMNPILGSHEDIRNRKLSDACENDVQSTSGNVVILLSMLQLIPLVLAVMMPLL